MKPIAIIILAAAVISCDSASDKVADPGDYSSYVDAWEQVSSESAETSIAFWSRKLGPDSSGVGAIGPLSAAYAARFKDTGKVEYLHLAEDLLKIGVDKSAHNKDGFMMALAANYISQHKFREAKMILDKAREIPSNKQNLDLALFDVEMELGHYSAAYGLLKRNENKGNFSYLIRRSKWADHEGKLSEAIRYLEEADGLVLASGDKSLRAWTLTNLADYYGHAGEIEKSYQYYLAALELEPRSAYALKGIAWIQYSHNHNYKEANRILTHLIETRPLPDYYLLKSEIAEKQGLMVESQEWKAQFLRLAEEPRYGRMYNTYIIETTAQSAPERALDRARLELDERKTPETYALYAYALMENGRVDEALKVIEKHVLNHTYEPAPTYYAAKVLAASGDFQRSAALAAELEEASYELGPITSTDLSALRKLKKDA